MLGEVADLDVVAGAQPARGERAAPGERLDQRRLAGRRSGPTSETCSPRSSHSSACSSSTIGGSPTSMRPSAQLEDHAAAALRRVELERQRRAVARVALDALDLRERFTRDCAWRALVAFAPKRSTKRSSRAISACWLARSPGRARSRARPARCARRARCRRRSASGRPRARARRCRRPRGTSGRGRRARSPRRAPTSVCSSHSSDSMSRWLVGSSSSSRSAAGGERARERRARQLAAGEAVEAAVEILLGEAQPARHRGRAVAPQVAAVRLELGLRARVAVERRLVGRAVGHPPLERRQLAPRSRAPRAAREQVVAQRDVALARRALVVQRDPRALGERSARRRRSTPRRRASAAASSCRRRCARRSSSARGARA